MTMAASAQTQKPCNCAFTIKYPETAIDSNISGKVIVEIDEDENGLWSNPKVIKGIGYGCDEEALRIANQQINCHNKCEGRYRPQVKTKKKLPVNFTNSEDGEPKSKTIEDSSKSSGLKEV